MSERIEQTFRCPDDGRKVAEVVATSAGRFLAVKGGRVGYARRIETLRHQLGLALFANAVVVRPTRIRILDSEPDWVAGYRADMSRGIYPEALPEDAFEQIWPNASQDLPNHESFAVCPRCHRVFAFTITKTNGIGAAVWKMEVVRV